MEMQLTETKATFTTGGVVNLTVNGDQSKAINSNQNIIIEGGDIDINMTGGAVLEASGLGSDVSYSTALNADWNIKMYDGDLSIITSGSAGRGLRADSSIYISGGAISINCSGDGAAYTNELGEDDAYGSNCMKADIDIDIIAGELLLVNSGTAGKGINCDGVITFGTNAAGPIVDLTTTGASITVTAGTGGGGPGGGGPGGGTTGGDESSSKAVRGVSGIIVNNGDITVSSADDGMKSEVEIIFNGGVTHINESFEGIESLLIEVNGGYIYVTASDDAVNATAGEVSGGTEQIDASWLRQKVLPVIT
jgi:hypothetical protein